MVHCATKITRAIGMLRRSCPAITSKKTLVYDRPDPGHSSSGMILLTRLVGTIRKGLYVIRRIFLDEGWDGSDKSDDGFNRVQRSPR